MEKQKVEQLVAAMPDDVDVDTLIERLYLLKKIEEGEKEIAAGAGIPHEEAERRLEKWLK
jgi:predicted transcriptional regulator